MSIRLFASRPSKPGDRAANALLLRCYTTIDNVPQIECWFFMTTLVAVASLFKSKSRLEA
jgi:hypothetical protein